MINSSMLRVVRINFFFYEYRSEGASLVQSIMDDEERLEGEEEMELDEASDGDDDDDETTGIPVSPATSDQLIGAIPTPGNGKYLI